MKVGVGVNFSANLIRPSLNCIQVGRRRQRADKYKPQRPPFASSPGFPATRKHLQLQPTAAGAAPPPPAHLMNLPPKSTNSSTSTGIIQSVGSLT